jgi:hypothetical protein
MHWMPFIETLNIFDIEQLLVPMSLMPPSMPTSSSGANAIKLYMAVSYEFL